MSCARHPALQVSAGVLRPRSAFGCRPLFRGPRLPGRRRSACCACANGPRRRASGWGPAAAAQAAAKAQPRSHADKAQHGSSEERGTSRRKEQPHSQAARSQSRGGGERPGAIQQRKGLPGTRLVEGLTIASERAQHQYASSSHSTRPATKTAAACFRSGACGGGAAISRDEHEQAARGHRALEWPCNPSIGSARHISGQAASRLHADAHRVHLSKASTSRHAPARGGAHAAAARDRGAARLLRAQHGSKVARPRRPPAAASDPPAAPARGVAHAPLLRVQHADRRVR